jgi:uncharacterized protein YdhG (YjbR/CyaY superfamily)
MRSVSTAEIDEYLASQPEPKRGTLEEVRRRIRSLVPSAEEGISYALPAFLVDGKPIAGLAAFAHHLSYLPHSGSVLTRLGPLIDGYEHTAGSLHFPVDEPLPVELLRALLTAKAELLGRPDAVVPPPTAP